MNLKVKKELHEIVEFINSMLLFIALFLLILSLKLGEGLEALLFYLDTILAFTIVVELTIKYLRSEDDKKFFKENWLVILSLLPLVLFFRLFYFLGFIKEEKEAEKLNLLIHEADKFLKEREVLKTRPLMKVLYFLLRRPILPRVIQRLIGLWVLKLTWFEDKREKTKEEMKKSAFSLDLETLVKVILLLILITIFVMILLSLKNSKLFLYLKWM